MSKKFRKFGRVRLLIGIGLCCLVGLLPQALAEAAGSPQGAALPVTITISPPTPTIVDTVRLFVDGEWQNSCTPELEKVTVFSTDRVVRIDAISNAQDGACFQALTPYAWQVDVQFDLAGVYQLFLYVQDGPGGQPAMMAATEVDVAGGLRITPAIATTHDAITAVVSDVTTTTCVPVFQGRTIEGTVVYIDALFPSPGDACGTAVTSWGFRVDLSDLEPGMYSVELRLFDAGDVRLGSRVLYRSHLFVAETCLLYTSPSPRDRTRSRMPSSA